MKLGKTIVTLTTLHKPEGPSMSITVQREYLDESGVPYHDTRTLTGQLANHALKDTPQVLGVTEHPLSDLIAHTIPQALWQWGAAEGTLTVLDAETALPINGATLLIDDGGTTVARGRSGVGLEWPYSPTARLIVRAPGYQTLSLHAHEFMDERESSVVYLSREDSGGLNE